MYWRPVADSIERVRAVWTAAHDTTSGKIRPTISRSQTKSAYGPVRAANGASSAGPAPVADPDPEQDDLDRDDGEQCPRQEDERRFGQFRRDEIPVAEDHRGEDPAGGRCHEGELEQQRRHSSRVAAPPQDRAAKTRASTPAPSASEFQPRTGRRPDTPDEDGEAPRVRRTPGGRRHGAAPTAGSSVTGESTIASGSAPSDSQASRPKTTAQAAVKPRNPDVADVRRRRSTTAP